MDVLEWGVVGVGRAGRARVEALRADPRAEVVGAWRGRVEEAGLRSFPDLDALLEGCRAVTVCAPDRFHPELVRAALDRGRHVVCEFPLAGSAGEARALYDLARERGVRLHVEHIELLGSGAAWLRERCRGRRVLEGEVRFTGGPRTDLLGEATAHVARLHRLRDAAGPLEVDEVRERAPGALRAVLRTGGGGRVDLDLRRFEGASRRTVVRLRLDDGEVVLDGRTAREDGREVGLPPGPRLFQADQLAATAWILDGAEPYVGQGRVVEILGLAEALERA